MTRPDKEVTAGIVLKYGDSGGEATTRLAGIRKFSDMPSVDFDEFETTEVDAFLEDGVTPRRSKTFEPGKFDVGMVNFTLSFNAANVALMYTMKGLWKSWAVVLRSGASFPFEGWIKTIKPVANEKEEVLFDVTIRLDDEEEEGFVPAA